jgi:hypothetical protein
MTKHQVLTADEHRALQAYADAHGRTWKADLRWAWENASEPGILQLLRNASYFGPRGLNAYKLAPPLCEREDIIGSTDNNS